MGLIIVDKLDDIVEAITFEDFDNDSEICICIDLIENDKTINFYMKKSQVEALKRHIDSELEKLNNNLFV